MNDPKFIIVAGCYRSGTTALFNIVRLVLKHSGKKYEAYFWDGQSKGTDGYELVKTHTWNQGLAEKAEFVFNTYRGATSTINSMKSLRKRGVSSEFANAADYKNHGNAMAHADLWHQYSHYTSFYSILRLSPLKIINDIANKIGVHVQMHDVFKEFQSLKAPTKGFDPVTLLTETHYKIR